MKEYKKIAIVTGGSRGIGYAICKKLQNLNYYIISLDRKPLFNSSFNINEEVINYEVKGDVNNDKDVDDFFEQVKQKMYFLDAKLALLVNNAGVASAKRFMNLEEDDFKEMMETNLYGAFKMSKKFVELSKDSDIQKHIINISSVSGLTGFSGHAHYCASKFALNGMMQVMAKELGKLGKFCVNNVCPGPTLTDMWTKLDSEYKKEGFMPEEANEDDYSKKLIIKRMGRPEDVAQAIEIIINSDYITGINIPVCGGNILR